ncbi:MULTISPECIES: T9SS C-terminal target domain-containing protein [unclassified Flavobacterium]|uniref:T9SS C-terminal target domain-containing protein n=1 Tax=unclassified Flavobacterium TaxID=196869 RepID=UPI001F138A1A|nr:MULTISPECIES: T9SS C-terminal target domain-containing protein [unclassified Flavobacterium]UMY64902.1 T9SS C-terminal target domain-containing protein [Flavobacterium sp. HJ-32-4]
MTLNQAFFWRVGASLLCCLSTYTGVAQGDTLHEIAANRFETRGLRAPRLSLLDKRLSEGSGLVAWNGQLWSHNDSGAAAELFAIDTATGKIVAQYPLPGLRNVDWEELAQDDAHFYIGDFGNNGANRKRLSIYKVGKRSVLEDQPKIETLSFEWPKILDATGKKEGPFDCEAMVVVNDTIFLFTKEWKERRGSRIFSLPTTPGHHVARYVASLKTRLLVTGADYNRERNQVTLIGYNMLVNPRVLQLQLPENGDFRKIREGKNRRIRRHFRQVEGITSFDGRHFYAISEAIGFLFIRHSPALYTFDLP